jgi:membrane-bound inhibitor of C-type lysozyme/uncharacterized membrane protein
MICRRLNVLGFAALLASCTGLTPARDKPESGADLRPRGQTFVYECTGYEFVARLTQEEMALWLDDRSVVLARVPSGSGTKYTKGEITFWSKGEQAILDVDKQRFTDCVNAPHRVPWEEARRRGVDFRAVGNEPGWSVEIQLDRQLLFVGDYGMNRVMIANPEFERVGKLRIYSAKDEHNSITVEVVDTPCTDTMKGNTFASEVVMQVNGQRYTGCGNSLLSDWQ